MNIICEIGKTDIKYFLSHLVDLNDENIVVVCFLI